MFNKKAFWEIATAQSLLSLAILLIAVYLPKVGIWLCVLTGAIFGLAFVCGIIAWCTSKERIFGISAGLALVETAACTTIALLYIR